MPYSIRNSETGLEKNFPDRQGVADFLYGRDDVAVWEGVSNISPLPEPSAEVTGKAEAESPETAQDMAPKVESDSTPSAENEAEIAPFISQESPHDVANASLLERLEEAIEHVIHPGAAG